MSVVLALLPATRIALYEVTRRASTASQLSALRRKDTPLPETLPHGYAPDIYYFVLDRYPNEKTLARRFEFDNGPYLTALRRRGFYVVSEARANYATTPLSLASSLNLEYLDEVRNLVGESTTDMSLTFALIRDHRLHRLLRARGYRYVHVGSWWEPTRSNPLADTNIASDFPVSEFVRELVETTAARPLFYESVDFAAVHRKQVLFKLSQFGAIADLPAPKLVFAHLLVPHPPFVFNRDGSPTRPGEAEARGDAASFLEQVRFINSRMLEVVDQILAHSQSPPVIVLQSDEGPHVGGLFEHGRMSRDVILTKTYIFSALYLPDVAPATLDSTLTPVNTFRMICNEYFGAGYPLYENHVYWFADPERPYRYVDVSHVVY